MDTYYDNNLSLKALITVALLVKNPPAMQKTWVRSLPWEKQLPTPVFWLGEFHGQRSLVDYSLVGHKESVTTE